VRAYNSMEFGYAAALALILTFLLLTVVWLYVRRASRDLDQ
jgi:multiple sugar transport system permease protein